MKVLVAVPVFNEEKYVSPVMREIRKYTRAAALNDLAITTRVLVIDDGSTDGTSTVLQDLAAKGHIDLITHPENHGYGQSLIDAFAFAAANDYDWVITMDCDEQHEPCGGHFNKSQCPPAPSQGQARQGEQACADHCRCNGDGPDRSQHAWCLSPT